MIKSRLRTVGGLLAAIVGVALGQAALATPAFAEVPLLSDTGYIRSANDATAYKTVDAYCPTGQVVIGGGAETSNSLAQFRTLTPFRNVVTGQYGYKAIAVSHGVVGSWQVSAKARCAPAPAGYELKSTTSVASSNYFTFQHASCGAGRQVLAAGGSVRTQPGDDAKVTLLGVRPDPEANNIGASAWGQEAGSYSGTWDVIATAVCATTPTGYTTKDVANTSGGAANNQEFASGSCATGTRIYSAGGYAIATAEGTVPPGLIELEAMTSNQLGLIGSGDTHAQQRGQIQLRLVCGA